MSKSRRPRTRKTSPLLIDTLAPPLLEQCKEYLRRGLPPDATQFDRVTFQAMADFLWMHCADVERTPGKVSGAWCVKGTRIPVEAILDNAQAGCSAEEIAGPDIYPELSVDVVRRILDFAADRS